MPGDSIAVLADIHGNRFALDAVLALRGLRRRKNSLIKVLNNGEISAALTVHAHKFSKAAKEAIEKAGGQAILIGGEATAA